MTRNELQTILIDRIKTIQNSELSAEERQAENEITQTVIKIAQFMLTKLNTDTDNTALPEKMSNVSTNTLTAQCRNIERNNSRNYVSAKSTNNSNTCFAPIAENRKTEYDGTNSIAITKSQNIENENPQKALKSNRCLSFTDKHENWLIDNFGNYTNMLEITDAFNKHFGVLVNRQLITEKCKLYGLMNHRSVKYTLKEDDWLKKHADTMPYETLADLFETHFHRRVKSKALKAHCRNLGIIDRDYCRMAQANKKSQKPLQIPVNADKIYNSNSKNEIIIQNSVNYIMQKA